jgi:hypothetical protein
MQVKLHTIVNLTYIYIYIYKVIHNRLLESIITIYTQYNNNNKQQIYSTIFKRLIVPDLSILCFCSKIYNKLF